MLSTNHRSEAFMQMIAELKAVLAKRQNIPDDYSIVFTSSATECWEIIAQSLTKKCSQHFHNGAFGEKWMKRAGALVDTVSVPFDLNAPLPVELVSADADVICVTQNETANGSCVSSERMQKLRSSTDQLIAVDATSSMGGLALDFTLADVWFASVQKCFGLPAGMGVMLLSPRAVKRAEELNDRLRYNSLLTLLENWNKNQAPYTPNVLDLYLLHRTQMSSKPIAEIEKKLEKRYAKWVDFLEDFPNLNILPQDPSLRSMTVLTIQSPDPETILRKGLEVEITMGKGYGAWKESTFRIANFPAIKRKEISKAQTFLRKFC
jgi:phosphoserine aminotransferase